MAIDLRVLPQFMQEWIESLGLVKDIQDLSVEREAVPYVSYGERKSFVSTNYLDVKVIIPPLEHCCRFVQFKGEWMKAGENTDIAYTGKHETVVENKELDDNDAFDLMDSIRDELWK